MLEPSSVPKTIYITNNVNNGDKTLQAIPRIVRLYFFVKSRFESS